MVKKSFKKHYKNHFNSHFSGLANNDEIVPDDYVTTTTDVIPDSPSTVSNHSKQELECMNYTSYFH